MADFGQCGVRSVHTYNADATVNDTNDEYLQYELDVEGGMREFVFSCEHRPKITETGKFQGHPKQHYEWKLRKNGTGVKDEFGGDKFPKEPFEVGVLFLGATEYHLIINKCDSTKTVIENVQDITYASQCAEDFCNEGLMVTWS